MPTEIALLSLRELSTKYVQLFQCDLFYDLGETAVKLNQNVFKESRSRTRTEFVGHVS